MKTTLPFLFAAYCQCLRLSRSGMAVSALDPKIARFRTVLASLDAAKVVRVLPVLSLSSTSGSLYKKTGENYIAFCTASSIPPFPPSYASVMGFLLVSFLSGVTPTSLPSFTSRLKFYTLNFAGSTWLSELERLQVCAGRRALAKLKIHRVKKSKPISPTMLAMIKVNLTPLNKSEVIFLSLWSLAFATMQRLGETVKTRRFNLRLFRPAGHSAFFVYCFRGWNLPKVHKVKAAPYAVISEKNNKLAFDLLLHLLNTWVPNDPEAVVFPQVDNRDGTILPAPVTSRKSIFWLRGQLNLINVPDVELYGATSARRGSLTDALDRGVPLSACQVQGHWKVDGPTPVTEYQAHDWVSRIQHF